MNAIANAVKGMAGTLECMAGYWGNFTRYGGPTARIKGLLIDRDYEVIDDDGIVTSVKSHDWIFRAEKLGSLMPPKPGDLWEVTECGLGSSQEDDLKDLTYEVMTIGKRPCFEAHDAQGIMVVVHTKRVANG